MASVVKWRFDDPTDSTFAIFEINPDAGGSLPLQKTITSQSTLAPGGKTLLFEGSTVAPVLNFTGTILTQSMYNLYVLWFNKRHQVQLTDDLGRVMMIYVTQFTPVRVHHAGNFWFHTFTVNATIVDWP